MTSTRTIAGTTRAGRSRSPRLSPRRPHLSVCSAPATTSASARGGDDDGVIRTGTCSGGRQVEARGQDRRRPSRGRGRDRQQRRRPALEVGRCATTAP